MQRSKDLIAKQKTSRKSEPDERKKIEKVVIQWSSWNVLKNRGEKCKELKAKPYFCLFPTLYALNDVLKFACTINVYLLVSLGSWFSQKMPWLITNWHNKCSAPEYY